jgi:hypothetical protein
MEKKRSRFISGWRQVERPKSGFGKRRTPLVAPVQAPVAPPPPADKAAGERWESEGGHLAATAK